MLSVTVRSMRKEAKKSLIGMKRVFKLMEESLNSENEKQIRVASAFFQVLKYHIHEGDLRPEEITLATLLRGQDPTKER